MQTLQELDKRGIRGAYDAAGYFTGFDYPRQTWIVTDPATDRDPASKPGTASNPLSAIPTS